MSTTTTIALTTYASIAANNSSSDFYKSKESSCKAIESSFNNTTASIEQKQQYAQCIDILYPNSPNDILLMKVLVIISFLAFMFGFIKGYKEDGVGIGLLLGGGLALFIPFILVVLYSGITFLFS